MRRKMAAGNWKMNGSRAALLELEKIADASGVNDVDVLICPPAVYLSGALSIASGTSLDIGAQDCHFKMSGAHTGDISAEMIADLDASHVILGHSERRADHGEMSETVQKKAEAALASGLTAIICIGETEEERVAGETLDVIESQLTASVPDLSGVENTVIAYEPVWAIGTGRTATTHEISEVHDFIRGQLRSRFASDGDEMRVLYGGSVKPSNASDIFATDNVDGALVGGASLKALDFIPIIEALSAS